MRSRQDGKSSDGRWAAYALAFHARTAVVWNDFAWQNHHRHDVYGSGPWDGLEASLQQLQLAIEGIKKHSKGIAHKSANSLIRRLRSVSSCVLVAKNGTRSNRPSRQPVDKLLELADCTCSDLKDLEAIVSEWRPRQVELTRWKALGWVLGGHWHAVATLAQFDVESHWGQLVSAVDNVVAIGHADFDFLNRLQRQEAPRTIAQEESLIRSTALARSRHDRTPNPRLVRQAVTQLLRRGGESSHSRRHILVASNANTDGRIAMHRLTTTVWQLHEKIDVALQSGSITANVPVIDQKVAERDKWMYEQRLNGRSLKEIAAELSRLSESRSWDVIDSQQGVYAAIGRYCKRRHLPRPMNRRRNHNGA